MNTEVTGVIIEIGEAQQISASFTKREFVIEEVNERNQDWNDFHKIQFVQDKCALLDGYQVGQEVRVSLNIKGRKWEKEGKVNYFTSLDGWKIESVGQAVLQTTAPQQTSNTPPPSGPNEDLPF